MGSSAPPFPGEPRERLALQAVRLQALTTALSQALTPMDVARIAVEHGRSTLGARTGSVWLVDAGRGVLRRQLAIGADPRLVEMLAEIPLEGGTPMPPLDVVRSGEPLWIASHAEMRARYPELARRLSTFDVGASTAVLPLLVEGRALGVLAYNWEAPRGFDEDERVYQLLLAQHIGQALARARLYEAERAARAEAETLRERAAFLASASALLGANLEYLPTLQSLARLAVPRFADWCIIQLAPGVGPQVEPVVAHADAAKVTLAREFSRRYPPRDEVGGGVSSVLRTGIAELYPEISDEMLRAAAQSPEHLDMLRQLSMRSGMIVPLRARGRVLGVITFVAAESGRRYDEEELAVAEDLAHRAALAIDNARLLAEARQAARARDEFLAIASHELRNPLNALQLQLVALRRAAERRPETVDADWVRERLVRAGGQVDRLVDLIDRLLDVSRLSTGKLVLEPQPLDLAELARQVADRCRDLPGAAELRLRTDEEVCGEWDRLRMEQVLANLVQNALKYGDGKPVEVEVRDLGERASIVVRDQGIGIPEEHQQRIFERFERGPAERRYAGFGLGLWIARRAVEASGGTMQVRSAPGAGATFEVLLPKRAPERPLDDTEAGR